MNEGMLLRDASPWKPRPAPPIHDSSPIFAGLLGLARIIKNGSVERSTRLVDTQHSIYRGITQENSQSKY